MLTAIEDDGYDSLAGGITDKVLWEDLAEHLSEASKIINATIENLASAAVFIGARTMEHELRGKQCSEAGESR